ncbi:ESX-1 secretion-associated protein [Mycolicibacterium brumae]|uniref:ESX-1 secretion-associated protein n=1 Tax=Mycolicibacterium brumae TaxID=85968 RepID=A0A2G5PDG5_9MYCO|nr:ESX-1 secretion-associated protein [Mycolicibacterium brumae]MCV7191754.1 ESX-1 secretion-associated protein [Mycolicibacterium brumae]PIB76357.1 ESX-1 secretion-associated protein [Mycolicibacterium brumae]RWA15871.1 hypothetical protein MBRU_09990 [Mycolicibacterium brumae DSM 44177]UWW07060.1 ESX-1 secretion-associated protein [Mycolicibacterium brumae]
MADHIDIDTDELRRIADLHNEAAGYLSAVPATHPAIQRSVDSLGPIFSEFRSAARTLLEERRRCYQAQADAHQRLSQNLGASATLWQQQDAAGAETLRAVVDEP